MWQVCTPTFTLLHTSKYSKTLISKTNKQKDFKKEAKLPFGQVPALQINDGKLIAQSKAIERHLARTFNLFGSSVLEELEIDSVSEGIEDVWTKYRAAKYYAHATEKEEKLRTFGSETLPLWLEKLEKILEGNKHGVLVGERLSYADVSLFHLLDSLEREHVEAAINDKPLLQKHKAQIESIPALKHYLTIRQN